MAIELEQYICAADHNGTPFMSKVPIGDWVRSSVARAREDVLLEALKAICGHPTNIIYNRSVGNDVSREIEASR